MLRAIVASPPTAIERVRAVLGGCSPRLRATRKFSPYFSAALQHRSFLLISGIDEDHYYAPPCQSNSNIRWFSIEKELQVDESEDDAASSSVVADTPETLEDHYKKPRKKKKKSKEKKVSNSSKTRENAESVFDFIASHTDLPRVQTWSTRLKNRAKQKRIPHHKSIEERVHYVFHSDDTKEKKKKFSPPPVYVQKALAQFFGGNQITRDIEEDDPKVINRRNWESNVDTLVRARELAVQRPLLWSNRENKNLRAAYRIAQKKIQDEENDDPSFQKQYVDGEEEEEEEESEQPILKEKKYLRDRASRITTLHDWKPEKVRRDEAEALASILADCLPPEEHDSLMKLLKDFAAKKKNSRIRILFVHLKKATKAHVIWIASDVAKFFYVDTPDNQDVSSAISDINQDASKEEEEDTSDEVIMEENDEDVEDDESSSSPSEEEAESNEALPAVMGVKADDPFFVTTSLEETTRKGRSADPRLQEAYNKWNMTRNDFVENLLDLYNSPFSQLWRITPDMIKDQTEETTDLDTLIKNREERQNKNTKARRKKVHLVFDAIMLQPQWSSTGDQQEEEKSAPIYVPPATDRIVFIDNLPIDIHEMEIIDNYSRCGPIESVRIYNQRPDLDPGPMSRQKVVKALKKQKFRFQTRGRWQRPRTPIYATITFADNEGYEKAMQDSLRVFGMVIRKHPVRSIRASEMTKFYLEGIPPGFFSTDVEHTVSSLLHPHVYVCLGMQFRNYDEPTSCEFRFGTFEAAHHAFEKLDKELNMGSDECTLNWIRSPKDAMEYWTRKRGLVMP